MQPVSTYFSLLRVEYFKNHLQAFTKNRNSALPLVSWDNIFFRYILQAEITRPCTGHVLLEAHGMFKATHTNYVTYNILKKNVERMKSQKWESQFPPT